jgi:long-chain acyl-CoA synthetase
MVRRACAALTERGFTGVRIALVGEPSLSWFLAFSGIVCSGNTAVLVAAGLGARDVDAMMKRVGARAIICAEDEFGESDFARANGDGPEVIGFGSLRDRGDKAAGGAPALSDPMAAGEPSLPAVLAFTSGTTGSSKIVSLSHSNICSDASACIRWVNGLDEGGRTLAVLPTHHLFGVTVGILAPLLGGIEICFGRGPGYLAKDAVLFRPAVLVAVPILLEGMHRRLWSEAERTGQVARMRRGLRLGRVLRRARVDLRRRLFASVLQQFGGELRYIVCGGAPLRNELIGAFDDLGITVLQGYGITECSPAVACNAVEKNRVGSVGIPVVQPFGQVTVVDGEICVSGRIVMGEYLDDPAETALSRTEDGWFRTGDLGRIDKDGYLFVEGRSKDLIILSDGNNVAPQEIEDVLERLEHIQAVLVDGFDDNGRQGLIAYVFLTTDAASDSERTREKVRDAIRSANERFPPYKRIQRVEFVDQDFARTALGKIRRFLYTRPVG